MARPKSLKPAYCLHKPSRRAFVKINGKRVYLGPHGSQESRDEYDRIVGEWIARGRQSPQASGNGVSPTAPITVVEVAAAFWTASERFYLNADNRPTSAHGHYRAAMRLMNRLYGRKPAIGFGPLARIPTARLAPNKVSKIAC